MKIAFDMDGTILEYPQQYGSVIHALKAYGGYHITIMTGRKDSSYPDDIDELRCLGIAYDDFLNSGKFNPQEIQLERWALKGQISCDRDEVVCMWKAREIRERGFDIVIDDAADKIRLYIEEDSKAMILKSPTAFNQVFAKWGKDHIVEHCNHESN